jgi:hypothetical protein
MAKRKGSDLPRLRYGMLYLFDSRKGWTKNNVVSHGATEHLVNAIGNAAWHVERSLEDPKEYGKAVVYDRHEMRILFIYSRTAEGVRRQDLRNEHRPYVKE